MRCTGVCGRAYAHMHVRAREKTPRRKNAVPEKRRAGKTPYAQKTNTASSDSRINFAILKFRPIRQTKSVRHSFPFDFSGENFLQKSKIFKLFLKIRCFFLAIFL